MLQHCQYAQIRAFCTQIAESNTPSPERAYGLLGRGNAAQVGGVLADDATGGKGATGSVERRGSQQRACKRGGHGGMSVGESGTRAVADLNVEAAIAVRVSEGGSRQLAPLPLSTTCLAHSCNA